MIKVNEIILNPYLVSRVSIMFYILLILLPKMTVIYCVTFFSKICFINFYDYALTIYYGPT